MIDRSYMHAIEEYYARRETRWGYKYILAGNKHYGYYPGGKRISLRQALINMCDEVGKELDLAPGSNVLDAGCGEGVLSFRLAEKSGYQMTGIDILKINIDIANNIKNKRKLSNPSFMVGDFSDMRFPDNSFDGVVILEALVHSPDYKKTLAEVRRVLKPGGIFVTHNYVMPDKMTPKQEHIFKVVYDGSGMNTLDQFRISKMGNIWLDAGFVRPSSRNGIKKITPMMRRLWQLAYVPYKILKLLGKEEAYTNTYAGFWMYKVRSLIRYDMTKAYRPEKS